MGREHSRLKRIGAHDPDGLDGIGISWVALSVALAIKNEGISKAKAHEQYVSVMELPKIAILIRLKLE